MRLKVNLIYLYYFLLINYNFIIKNNISFYKNKLNNYIIK